MLPVSSFLPPTTPLHTASLHTTPLQTTASQQTTAYPLTYDTTWGPSPEPTYLQFQYELSMSFNRKQTWTQQDKKTIQNLLLQAYEMGGSFHNKMVMEYNIVHVVKEIHTTEAGRHFNIQMCNNPLIIEKPRTGSVPGSVSSTIHCRVCKNMETGELYIAKFSQIVDWL
jgi:hypothetical protein